MYHHLFQFKRTCLANDFTADAGSDICEAWNPVCLGEVYGVIGKLKIYQDSEWRLLLIKQERPIGELPNKQVVYKIEKVAILPLTQDKTPDMGIQLCRKHHFGIKKSEINRIPDTQPKSLQKTWNSIKSAAESVKPKKLPAFKSPLSQLGDLVNPPPPQQKELKERERFERKIIEEIHKMFSETGSFYYCKNGDLTKSTQSQHSTAQEAQSGALWETADDRFFWNKFMLQELIDSKQPLSDPWIVPVIQGYAQIEVCGLRFEDQYGYEASQAYDVVEYKLCVISRRSRYRTGTRYKRRGVDEDGYCANYVETEQIVEFSNHVVSFVQVRGSIPLYWSQTGNKYKPPPRIEKGDAENHDAFSKHFEHQIQLYKQVAVISLLDLYGKEKVMADAFLLHTVKFNSEVIQYVAFDFHEYCRGMKFENVSILTENILDIIKEMRYCWVDHDGMICDQKGVFRVNCLDCLDRTNVVQSAIARVVLEIQCRKLGLLPPEESLPQNCRLVYQQMWANNGDAISRQYAGTAALKGDFTRTGERKIAGLMKDGMNSANRYYINKVKDVYKQATLDLLLGNSTKEDWNELGNPKADEIGEEAGLVEKEENLKTLIDDCKKMLITEPEECLGGWGLIDCDQNSTVGVSDPSQLDMDTIVLLSQRAYYVASYDDEADQVTSYLKIFLEDLHKIEIGPCSSFFKSKYLCIRVYYLVHDQPGYFHTFRTTNTRLFNNILISISNEDEARESLRAISESFCAAQKLMSLDLPVTETKLERKKSKPHPNVIDIAVKAQEKVEMLPRPSLATLGSDNDLPSSPTRLQPSLRQQSTEKSTVVPSSESEKHIRLSSGMSRTDRNNSGGSFGGIGRTFARFNPMKKVRPPKLPNFLPNVLYSRYDTDSLDSDDGGLGKAKISESGQERKDRQNKESSNNSTAQDFVAENSPLSPVYVMGKKGLRDHDFHADCCGVVMAKPHQNIQNHFTQIYPCRKADVGSQSMRPSRDKVPPRTTRYYSIQEDQSHSAKAAQFFIGQEKSIDENPDCLMGEEEDKEDEMVTHDNISSSIGGGGNEVPTGNLIDFSDMGQSLPEVTPDSTTPGVQQQPSGRQKNEPLLVLDSEWVNVDIEAPSTSHQPSCETTITTTTTADNTTTTINHSLLETPKSTIRISLSDSALASLIFQRDRVDAENEVDDGMDGSKEGPLQAIASFSRLRNRMTALAMPSKQSPQTRRRQLLEQAQNNIHKSTQMFKDCKSQIILL